ncbi:MAG: hypothetical protein H7327_15560 [Herminiimonas sp.]|nr:hypothetical protein [Herminiimonas sp.]
MRNILNIVGGIFIFFGLVWILQGIDILPGSFMTGQLRWAVYGSATAIVGILMLVTARRLKK